MEVHPLNIILISVALGHTFSSQHKYVSGNLFEKKEKLRNCALGFQRVNGQAIKKQRKRENLLWNRPDSTLLGGGMEVPEENSFEWKSLLLWWWPTKLPILVWNSQHRFLSVWNCVVLFPKKLCIFVPSCKLRFMVEFTPLTPPPAPIKKKGFPQSMFMYYDIPNHFYIGLFLFVYTWFLTGQVWDYFFCTSS